MRQNITPRRSDWLIAAAAVLLALVGLGMLDELNRLEQSTQAMQADTQRIRMAREVRP